MEESCCRVLRWTGLTLTGLLINGLGLQSGDVERQTPNPAAMPVCNPVLMFCSIHEVDIMFYCYFYQGFS